jgi:hypothetical protein
VGPVSSDYNVSVQIAGADGVPIVQRDGAPQGTFGFTSRWMGDQTYRDNHGLMLPADLPPGEYHIQVIVYRWQDGVRLPVTVAGADAGDVLRLVTFGVQGGG